MVLVIRMINIVNDNQDDDFREACYYYFEADKKIFLMNETNFETEIYSGSEDFANNKINQ